MAACPAVYHASSPFCKVFGWMGEQEPRNRRNIRKAEEISNRRPQREQSKEVLALSAALRIQQPSSRVPHTSTQRKQVDSAFRDLDGPTRLRFELIRAGASPICQRPGLCNLACRSVFHPWLVSSGLPFFHLSTFRVFDAEWPTQGCRRTEPTKWTARVRTTE